jgi:hypothetical protein
MYRRTCEVELCYRNVFNATCTGANTLTRAHKDHFTCAVTHEVVWSGTTAGVWFEMQLATVAMREELILMAEHSSTAVASRIPSRTERAERARTQSNLKTMFNRVITDWAVKDDNDVKLVIELKTPGAFEAKDSERTTHVTDCIAVRNSLIEPNISGVGKRDKPLQQIVSEAVSCGTRYALRTDGIDSLFMDIGSKDSFPGEEPQKQPKQTKDLTLRVQIYVARCCDRNPTVGQCLAYMLH